ncbi:MAG: hypothetical protein AMXMBFR64_40510 [Myxococcales bacterium]
MDPERQVCEAPTSSAPVTEAASPVEDQVCRQLSYDEILELMRSAAAHQPLTATQRDNLTSSLESLGNERFALLVRTLDGEGLLHDVLQELYETPATTTGGANQFEVPVLCYRFWNAANNIEADVRRANTIYGHHGIRITKVVDRTISREDTRRVTGHAVDDNFRLDRTTTGAQGSKRFTHADMAAVVREYVPTTAIAGLWAKRVLNQDGDDLSGTSSPAYSFGASYNKLAAVATDHSGPDTFAHELGHILTNAGHTHGGLMETGGTRDKTRTGADRLTAAEVTTIKSSVLGWVRSAVCR